MQTIMLRMGKEFYKFIKERAASRNISGSVQFEIMINRGVTVYCKQVQFKKQSDQKAVDICDFVKRSKVKFVERESGMFEIVRESYEDTYDMIETLRSRSSSKNKNRMDTTIYLSDGLVDYLQTESVLMSVSMSILIQHHLEEALALEALHGDQKIDKKWYDVVDDLMHSRVEFDEKSGSAQIIRDE